MKQCFYLRDYIILFWLLLCLMRSRLFQEFNKKSNSLYTILRSSKLAGSQRAPFLRQFLLRLNYNSFFEVDPLFICFLPFSLICLISCLSLSLRKSNFLSLAIYFFAKPKFLLLLLFFFFINGHYVSLHMI